MKRTIKAPLIGPSSYKEHGFRMLMIWASGLNPEISVGRELCDALSAVDKKSVAGEKFVEIRNSYLYLIHEHKIDNRERIIIFKIINYRIRS